MNEVKTQAKGDRKNYLKNCGQNSFIVKRIAHETKEAIKPKTKVDWGTKTSF